MSQDLMPVLKLGLFGRRELYGAFGDMVLGLSSVERLLWSGQASMVTAETTCARAVDVLMEIIEGKRRMSEQGTKELIAVKYLSRGSVHDVSKGV